MNKRLIAVFAVALLTSACGAKPPAPKASGFPAAARPVADIISSRWSDEDSRDSLGEFAKVMDRAGVKRGMAVADIGAGEGYYTVRLAARVGSEGQVLAQDIIPEFRDGLAARVKRAGLGNVSVLLGTPDNPKLPATSFDRAFLVHMYHEIASPYAFLWNLRPSVKPGGKIIVIDAERPTNQHGTPRKLLECEFAAVGYALVDFQDIAAAGGYFAAFELRGERPEPSSIKACSSK